MNEGDPTRKTDPTLLERQIAQILADDLEKHGEGDLLRKAKEDLLKERLRRISRIGNHLIYKAGSILRKIPQFKDAALEAALPNDRELDEPLAFNIGDTKISVNFYPFDISRISRRMNLDIAEGDHTRHLFVSTYLGLSNDDPDRRIKYWETMEDVQTKPVYGLKAAIKGLRMLRRVGQLGRIS